MKNIGKRYLGIGSILIGVVTFLLGSINIFTDYNASIADMSQAILGLGVVLIIFACLSIIVVENYLGTKINKLRVCICSIIAGVCLLGAMGLAFQPSFIHGNTNIHQAKDVVQDSIMVNQDSFNNLNFRNK